MKITLVNEELLPVPPVLGGPVEEIMYETAIAVQGPEMTVVSPFSERLNGVRLKPDGMFFHVDINAETEHRRSVFNGTLPEPFLDLTTQDYLSYLNGVTRVLNEINPDVVEIHNRAEFVPYMLKQFPDKKVVLYMHNEPVLWPLNMDEAISKTTAFVFVSDFLCKVFLQRYPSARDKVHVIHNSVNTEVWHPKVKTAPETAKIKKAYGLVDGQTLLFMGRTVHEKGIHCLLEAMVYVKAYLPEVKLLIAGSPLFGETLTDAFTEHLKQQASLLGDSIVFTGYVSHEMTPYFYAAADVTVVPSVWEEPFGKVVTESMGVGTPVVASRRGGIPEIIDDGCDGILVDQPEDEKALAAQIVSMLTMGDARSAMGDAAREKVVTYFDTAVRLDRVQSLYTYLESGA